MTKTKTADRGVFPVSYSISADTPPEAPKWLCHLARWRKHHQTKKPIFDMLPVQFKGPSRELVEAMALEWWDNETAKAKARKERPKKAAAARRTVQ